MQHAREDVEAAYLLFAANHPGMHDPAHRAFRAQLSRARSEGLREAGEATDAMGYDRALATFTASLADGHSQLFRTASGQEPRDWWPGFIAAWRGRSLQVHQAAVGSPAPVGSVIRRCDGMEVQTFLKRQLLMSAFRPHEAGQWWSKAPRAFIVPETLHPKRPAACTFLLPGGAIVERRLRWSPAPNDLAERRKLASDGELSEIGLSEPRAGLFLLGLGDFDPGPRDVERYQAMFHELGGRHGELARARAVVLDLRGNDGGSDHWPLEVAKSTWGTDIVERSLRELHRKVSIWWRASSGNNAYMPAMAARQSRNGDSDGARETLGIAEGMKKARTAGRPFFVETAAAADGQSPVVAPPTSFRTPVYVITPGRCASACLDALDIFTLFPNVKMIGAPTSSDSDYLEVRLVPLPSGRAEAVIPIKMWKQRSRASGQVYRPDIELDDLDWSTQHFLDHIENDLTNRKPA